MIIILDIPNYEFDNDIKDKFQDFFHRIYADIADPESIMCGNYERETIEMFLASFKHAAYLPNDITNGDMVKTLFGKDISNECIDYLCKIRKCGDWWNAPYKKGK